MATSKPAAASQLPLTEINNGRSFYEEAQHQTLCASCDRTGPFEAHHVVEKKHLKSLGAPRNSPDNALRLCAKAPDRCHERHTTHQELVSLCRLRDENIAFAARWLGRPAAYNYLTRYYTGTDRRVDALLEEP